LGCKPFHGGSIPSPTSKMEKIVHSRVKCPKCSSKDLFLVEVWEGHAIHWEQIDGKFDRNDGVLEPGDAYKVESVCKKCNHRWRIRNTLQIDDIIKDRF
jgi:hypothetical protein